MDRRVFLRETVMGAGVVACGVGGLWVRCARGRGQIVDELMGSARPVLDKHALDEQEQFPGPARAAIQRHFDRICLNSAEFVAEISAPEFRRNLNKMKTEGRRNRELLAAFYRRVPEAASVGDFVHARVREIGPKLDAHWKACCVEISQRWQVRIQKENGPGFDADDFGKRVTDLLRYQVEQLVPKARRVTAAPGWRDDVRSFSVEVLEAVPDATLDIGGQTIRLPEFAVNAMQKVFGTVVQNLGNPKWDCQRSVTDRMATLGRETGESFEKELRRRLNDLRACRENAVRLAAEQHAAERVGFFGEHG